MSELPGGVRGRIAIIDLNEESVDVFRPEPEVYRKYLGGRALGAYLALKHLEPGVDALSPENVLIAVAGLLTGTPAPAVPRFSLVAKSPLSGTIGQTEAGGFWGPALKQAGFDALVIKGRAQKPSYLHVEDGRVEIRSAEPLWGRTTGEVEEELRGEDSQVRVLQTGPAGENLVRYACVINDLRHANGRGGIGAVMGSKNLRAIAARGTEEMPCADKDKVVEIARWTAKNVMKHPLSATLNKYGTPAGVSNLNAGGMLPTHNFRDGAFDGYEKISGETMEETISVGRGGCYACPVRCKRRVEIEEVGVTSLYGGPEYEAVASFGSLLDNDDLSIIAQCHQQCNALGLDTISAGSTVAWAMECFENGLLDSEDADGLNLQFGDASEVPDLLAKIARREGFGDFLAEGSERAARAIGKGSHRFLTTVKGQEAPMQEPRAMGAMGLAYAVSPTGADHVTAPGDGLFVTEEAPGMEAAEALGILQPMGSRDLGSQKIRLYLYMHFLWSLYDSLGICYFGYAPRSLIPIDMMVDLVRAVSGWDTNLWELVKTGQRCVNLTRMCNVREGMSFEDDRLPRRFLEPLQDGVLEGVGIEEGHMAEALRGYYGMMGWNERGIPKGAVLRELDISDDFPELMDWADGE